jgi:Family of unknown function (DUF5681)
VDKRPGSRTENSAKNSAKPRRGNPDRTKPYRFQPGQSGNPGGRPRKYITEVYEQLALEPVPTKGGKTYAELLALAQFKKALKGNTMAAKEVTDRLEGKAREAVELTGPEGPQLFNLKVTFVPSDGNGRPAPEYACETCCGSGRDSSGLEVCGTCGGDRCRD